MRWGRKLLTIGRLTCIVISLIALPGHWVPSARAETGDGAEPDGPRRTADLIVDVNLYAWWLSRWASNTVVCEAIVEHEGLPTSLEIYNACGPEIHEDWLDTSFCSETDITKCPGVYLHLAGEGRGQKALKVELPPSEVWISIEGCDLKPPENRCDSSPFLKFAGEEPLPNETIIRIQGTINGEPFSCPGSECSIPLKPTGVQGQSIEFWADSSFGDSSEHFSALARVIPWGDFAAPEGETRDPQLWYVDVLSSQWRGERMASAAEIWEVFPSIGGPPQWLTTPDTTEGLASSISYYYLAGMLIRNGAVDASGCSEGGLATEQIANECGVSVAMPQVLEWQNQFDNQIIEVAKSTGVPAQLMKNIFSRESQFWPGIYKTYREAGLGQLTSNGADTLLLWNPAFFTQFCPLVLSELTCQEGFTRLSDYHQNMLRGALVQNVNASCPDCDNGIDLSQANFSVRVFAEGLLANAEQTGQIIYNITRRSPGEIATYNDLWRFTLVNYNAGPGCLANAVEYTWDRGESLTWGNVSAHLEEGCQDAIRYVGEISSVDEGIATTEANTTIPPEDQSGGEYPEDFEEEWEEWDEEDDFEEEEDYWDEWEDEFPYP